MNRAITNLLQALATGYILFFFSERLFWTVWSPGTRSFELVITWLAYSALAYLFLATVFWSRADDFWSVYLAGAVYGWLVEGALAHTLYGTQPSAPFPVSISITGLSWHALLSAVLGWWATAKALEARRPHGLVVLSSAIGVFWGLWAMFPRRETPPIITTNLAFLTNAVLLTIVLMASWWISLRLAPQRFRPGKIGIALCVVLLGLFFTAHVRMLGLRPLWLLPAVLSLALVPLYFHRSRTPIASGVEYEPRPTRLFALIAMPVVATIVYAGAVALRADRSAIIPIAIYVVSGTAGFVLLILAVVVNLRGKKRVLQ